MKTVTHRRYAEAVVAEAQGNPVADREELLLLLGKSPAEFGLDALAAAKDLQLQRIESLLLLLIERTNPPTETPRQPHIGQVVSDWL